MFNRNIFHTRLHYFLKVDDNCLTNLTDYDIPHINLYGPDGSMKKFYAYYIINKLNNININTKEFNIQEQNILIKNNNENFKLINHKYFKEIHVGKTNSQKTCILTILSST